MFCAQEFSENALDAMSAVGVIDYDSQRGDELMKIADAAVPSHPPYSLYIIVSSSYTCNQSQGASQPIADNPYPGTTLCSLPACSVP